MDIMQNFYCCLFSCEFQSNFFAVFPKAGLLALLAVAEHAGEFDKIIALSQR